MKKIMVVDDSSSMRQLVAFTLEDSGYYVVTATNGAEALEKLSTDQFSMVITDLNMPVMNGIDLIKAIRSRTDQRLTPVLMLTTESQVTKRVMGKQAGASGWITKPFTPDMLLKVVSDFIN